MGEQVVAAVVTKYQEGELAIMDMDAQQGDLAACSEEDGAVRCPLWRQVQQEARVMVGWVHSRVFLRVFLLVKVYATNTRANRARGRGGLVFWPFVPVLCRGFQCVALRRIWPRKLVSTSGNAL